MKHGDDRRRPRRYLDRRDGGQQLAERLRLLELHQPIVLALPRGGVPVGAEVAVNLDAPLDVLVARKIGAPAQPELAVGAIAEGGAAVFDLPLIESLGIRRAQLELTVQTEAVELRRRVSQYRPGRTRPDVGGRDVVLVDDGIATGLTARAALRALRRAEPRRLLLAAPVGAPASAYRLDGEADEVITVSEPIAFKAVGEWYEDFTPTTDDEVLELLAAVAARFHGIQPRPAR